jgi:hypothetical protein
MNTVIRIVPYVVTGDYGVTIINPDSIDIAVDTVARDGGVSVVNIDTYSITIYMISYDTVGDGYSTSARGEYTGTTISGTVAVKLAVVDV